MMDKPDTIAVDFDGTLSLYTGIEGDYSPDKAGEPILPMVARVKAWLKAGKNVVIFTARVHPFHKEEADIARRTVQDWCRRYIGKELEVTHEKHPSFLEIWDDRAVRVYKDIGDISDGSDVKDPLDAESDAIGNFLS